LTRCRIAGLLASAALALSLASAGPASAAEAHWRPVVAAPSAEDIAGPLGNGKLVVQAAGGLSLWRPGGPLRPFARGAGGYSTAPGLEPYIDLSSGRRLKYANCSFGNESIYTIEPSNNTIARVTRKGRASVFTTIPAGFLDGIVFDDVGRFGHRLLVTARLTNGSITLYGVDCRGRVRIFAQGLPNVEGGMVVAPRSFGRFGGQLITADENSGIIYAVSPSGSWRVVAPTGLPAGGDVGVESLGFFPTAAASFPTAYVASAQGATIGSGSNSILSISPNGLRRAGLRPGDLLAANETAGTAVRVRCAKTCSVVRVADGPPTAHVEGHIIFVTASG
jgi:hypothetical protein